MTQRYGCPIAACTWHLDAPPKSPSPGLAEFFITSTIDIRSRDVKQSLDAHFATHSIDEWVAEIVFVRACQDAAKDHARRAELKARCAEGFVRTLRKDADSRSDGPVRREIAKQLSAVLRGA